MLRNCGSDGERGVPECGRQRLHGRLADGSRAMHRAADAESQLQSAAGLLRLDQNGGRCRPPTAARTPPAACTIYGHADIRELSSTSRTPLPRTTGPSIWVCASIITMAWSPPRSRSRAWASPTTSSPPTRCCGFLRPHAGNPVQREPGALASEGCNNPVINALMASTITPCVSNAAESGLAQ
jgi:hypothetical protein